MVFLVYDEDEVNVGGEDRQAAAHGRRNANLAQRGRAVGLQSTFLASQPLLVLVPFPVDLKRALNGNNFAK